MESNKRKQKTQTLVLGAIFTALVIILQSLAVYTTFFGPFSTAVGLIPIVIGAAMCGVGVGAWLGFVFGMVVLLTGNAALFLAFNIPGTIITVLSKGIACGFAAGIVYKLLAKFNQWVAVIAAGIICPVVNTTVFLLGCYLFFMKHAEAIAGQVGLNVSGMALFWAIAMGNFIFELATNALLSPVITRVLTIKRKI